MDIGVPFKRLGKVDVAPLRDAILGTQESVWYLDDTRQRDYVVHLDTQSIVLLFCEGWPAIKVKRKSGWDLFSQQAMPIMADLLKRHYPPGGLVMRAVAARMRPGTVIPPHTDDHPSFHMIHRIHVPIATNRQVKFTVDKRLVTMKVGEAYEINNQREHSVSNTGQDDRIHFIFDYAPPEKLGRVVNG
jgi:quercetin dioxygenase-like cupin family protein